MTPNPLVEGARLDIADMEAWDMPAIVDMLDMAAWLEYMLTPGIPKLDERQPDMPAP